MCPGEKMCMHVCVCMCRGGDINACVYAYAGEGLFMHVCVHVQGRDMHACVHLHLQGEGIYMHAYVCLCVCVQARGHQQASSSVTFPLYFFL